MLIKMQPILIGCGTNYSFFIWRQTRDFKLTEWYSDCIYYIQFLQQKWPGNRFDGLSPEILTNDFLQSYDTPYRKRYHYDLSGGRKRLNNKKILFFRISRLYWRRSYYIFLKPWLGVHEDSFWWGHSCSKTTNEWELRDPAIKVSEVAGHHRMGATLLIKLEPTVSIIKNTERTSLERARQIEHNFRDQT